MPTIVGLAQAVGVLRAAVEKMARQIAALATGLTAVNDKTQRAGATIGPLGAGSDTDVTITWPKPWPDTAYFVDIELLCSTAALGTLSRTLKAGSKTTIDCIVTVHAAQAVATVGVDVTGTRT